MDRKWLAFWIFQNLYSWLSSFKRIKIYARAVTKWCVDNESLWNISPRMSNKVIFTSAILTEYSRSAYFSKQN